MKVCWWLLEETVSVLSLLPSHETCLEWALYILDPCLLNEIS